MSLIKSDKIALISRLKKAEGQLRGIQKIIESNNQYDNEKIIQQLSAVRGALDKAFYSALGGQMRRELGKSKGSEKISNYIELLNKYGLFSLLHIFILFHSQSTLILLILEFLGLIIILLELFILELFTLEY